MVAQDVAPRISRLSLSANPNVHPSAMVHEFSFLEGDVQINAGTLVAPGTAITAESGASVAVGEGVMLLPGVLVEGVAGGQVTAGAGGGQKTTRASVWIGDRTIISHKSIVHSPAFIDQDCLIGLRSTVFNARLGKGCVVMMHALVQDVEVPPGKCVPSGSVITSQHQADQLPAARPEDRELAAEIAGVSRQQMRSRSSQPRAESKARIVPVNSRASSKFSSSSSPPRAQSSSQSSARSNFSSSQSRPQSRPQSSRSTSYVTEGANMQAQRLSSETVQQVRQHLSSGYRIGMEHADVRRYRSGVWETCTPIKESNEQAVFQALERCLAEHQGEYVRMFGIDPAVKRRVGMTTVQRPGDKPKEASAQQSSYGSNSSSGGYSQSNNNGGASGGMGSGLIQEVRSLLQSGHVIGTEHADTRHYRSNVWKSCSPIDSRNEQEVISRLQHCLDEHSGEYVRMFGIDPKAKRRTATTTIQRADGKPVEISASNPAAASGGSYNGGGYKSAGSSPTSSGNNSGTASQVASQMLSQGDQIGIEIADARRYRSGIWQTAPSVRSASELQNFLSQNADKYVRVFSVNKKMKTRGSAKTIQKPGQANSSGNGGGSNESYGSQGSNDPINANPPHYDDPSFLKGSRPGNRSAGSSPTSSGNNNGMASQVVGQILSQGGQVGIEMADKRRYRSGIWQTAPSVRSAGELQSFLNQNADKYVRVFSVNKKMKTRGSATTVQKPGQANGSGSNESYGAQGSNDPINANPPHYDDPAFRNQGRSNNNGGSYGSNSNSYGNGGGSNDGPMDSEVLNQVTQLINQGCKIALEFADKRRFRSGIWQTGPSIDARRPAEAISALGKQLAQHQNDYVRLVGVDPVAKRRVVEKTIQRP